MDPPVVPPVELPDIAPGVVVPVDDVPVLPVAPGVPLAPGLIDPGIVSVLGDMPGAAVPVVPGVDVPGMLIVPEPVVPAVPVLSVDGVVVEPSCAVLDFDLPVVLLVALLPVVPIWLVPLPEDVCEIAAPLASSEAAPKIKSVVRMFSLLELIGQHPYGH